MLSYPFVQLVTLKQRTEKAAHAAGRTSVNTVFHILAPPSDSHYVSQLEMMMATLKIPLERMSKRTGRKEKPRLSEVADQTVRTGLNESVQVAAPDGVTFMVRKMNHRFKNLLTRNERDATIYNQYLENLHSDFMKLDEQLAADC